MDMGEEVKRCPVCGYLSTLKVGEDKPFIGTTVEIDSSYFACQNPKCNVERIYSDNAVMVSGK